MPELPEVEYTARQLQTHIVSATIRDVDIFWARTIGYPSPEDFRAEIAGRRIERVRRRGKFLLLDLSGDVFLTVHRRMTGNFLLLPPGWEIDCGLRETDSVAWDTRGPSFIPSDNSENSYSHELRYCRVCFNFADRRRLLYTDPRKFGRIELWAAAREGEVFADLGPEPLESSFTVEQLAGGLARHRTSIKAALLDQRVVAGVGNIYADEALFFAGIHPLRRSDSLTAPELCLLHKGIVTVLTLAIEHGGTSFNDYRDVWGEAGDNYNHVHVYQKDGMPCDRCGTTIERIVVAQRSTHFCPNCQPFTEA
ncbi:MAG TPA: DNA-formamidopyrimidine glycosylase [Ktedonobacteraceae bacterium]|jgi:formamidopyrimidine-DNA glycosylase